jgi:hypothetical protein
MKRKSTFADAFKGRWRISEMDQWDNDYLDLVEPAHITFGGAANGELVFGAVNALLDVRYGTRDGAACAEFTWQGFDEGDAACGRGWASFGTAGRLVGHLFIHDGDDSGFVAERD